MVDCRASVILYVDVNFVPVLIHKWLKELVKTNVSVRIVFSDLDFCHLATLNSQEEKRMLIRPILVWNHLVGINVSDEPDQNIY